MIINGLDFELRVDADSLHQNDRSFAVNVACGLYIRDSYGPCTDPGVYYIPLTDQHSALSTLLDFAPSNICIKRGSHISCNKMNFSSQQKQLVKPPQRGIFPLDHDAECKLKMQEYLGCLNQEKSTHYKCRELSRGYLQCRMDADLMAKEDLDEVYILIMFIVCLSCLLL